MKKLKLWCDLNIESKKKIFSYLKGNGYIIKPENGHLRFSKGWRSFSLYSTNLESPLFGLHTDFNLIMFLKREFGIHQRHSFEATEVLSTAKEICLKNNWDFKRSLFIDSVHQWFLGDYILELALIRIKEKEKTLVLTNSEVFIFQGNLVDQILEIGTLNPVEILNNDLPDLKSILEESSC